MNRFINSDIVYDYDVGIHGYNIFIYCGNSPISRIDISGKDSDLMDDSEDILEAKTLDGGGNHRAPAESSPSGNSGTGYSPTGGGGGVTNTIKIGNTTITFKHGGRHLEGTGLNTNQVEPIIANNVVTQNVPTTSSKDFYIDIFGMNLHTAQ